MMMMFTLRGEDEELVFVAPQHIVSIRTDPDGNNNTDYWEDTGSLVMLSTGTVIAVLENRNDIADELEKTQ